MERAFNCGRACVVSVVLIALAACAGGPEAVRVDTRELAPGVWLYTSWHVLEPWGSVPGNSVLVEYADGVLLIDSAWNDTQTRTLLAWAERQLGRPVTQAIFTHAHDDRMGGAAALRKAGVATYASAQTQALAPARGLTPASNVIELAPGMSSAAVGPATVFFPGAGHSTDNLVVYLADQRVLAGGCLIRSARSRSLGNTADANSADWDRSVAAVIARFPNAVQVIPGHGEPAGPELLTHTIALVEQSRAE